MGFRMLRPAATLMAVLLLAGCVPSEPVISPPSEPHSTPIFASDEDALAAATEAYAKYRSVLDEIFMEGGHDVSKLITVATGDQLQTEVESFEEVVARGLRSTGGASFKVEGLQQFDSEATDGVSIVVAYVCEDVSSVDVFDESGKSVVSTTRPDTSLYEVTFDLDLGSLSLLVAHKERWSTASC